MKTKKIEQDILTFLSKLDKDNVEFYYNENGDISQIRFLMKDSEPIYNKQIIINRDSLKELVVVFYQKKFHRDGKEINEYYENHELVSYFETELVDNIKITKGYTSKDELYSVYKTKYNSFGEIIENVQFVYDSDGKISMYVND